MNHIDFTVERGIPGPGCFSRVDSDPDQNHPAICDPGENF